MRYYLICPSCKKETIGRISMFFLIFIPFYKKRCKYCGMPYCPNKKWRENIIGFLIILLFVSGEMSRQENTYLPNILRVCTGFFLCFLVSFIAQKPSKIVMQSKKARRFDWVIVFFVVILYVYLALFVA
jgi:hypothetical protein